MFLDKTNNNFLSYLVQFVLATLMGALFLPHTVYIYVYREREDRCYTAGDRMEIESTVQISCWLELQAESCSKSSPATFCNTHMEPFICVLLHTNQTRLNKT